MKRLLAFFLAAVMVFGMMAGCGSTGNNDETDPKAPAGETTPATLEGMTEEGIMKAREEMLAGREMANTYQTCFTTSYSSLNYFSTSYATVREIVSNCVDGLVEPDKYGVYAASLADSWEHNENYTVWTFHIREGLKWIDHTGAETEYDVTAQDFVDGIRYIGDPLNGAYSMRVVRNLIAGLYDYYWGLDDIDCEIDTETNRADLEAPFDEMVGVRALDEYTVEYTLESSAPYFLSLIESSMLLPAAILCIIIIAFYMIGNKFADASDPRNHV